MAPPKHTHKNAELEDDPPVAAMESGGPPTSPGELTAPSKYEYEVVDGFFLQTRGNKKDDDKYLPVRVVLCALCALLSSPR